MNTLKKNLLLNSYSNNLFNEFKDTTKYFKDDEIRDMIYNNDNLLRFINNVQTKYKEVLYDDKEINKLMSSAINDDGKFNVRLLFNDYQQTKGIDESKSYFKFPDNFNSKFMADAPSHIINKKNLYSVEFTGNICGVNLNIRFHSQKMWFNQTTKKINEIEQYQKVVRILRRTLFVIKFFNTYTCNKGEHLTFDLFLVDTPKKLPKNRLDKLDQESINSGFTTFFNDANNTKTIIIYRGEEMEKLVIHELIHFFFLDFKYLKIDLSQILNVSPNTEFIPNESFTEFLTIIIQSSIMPIESIFKRESFKKPNIGSVLNTNDMYKKEIDMRVVFHVALELLYHEILFGFFQCAKILYQYNIHTTGDFFQKYNSKIAPFYYQKSCIISYFFIKVAMLTNIDESFAFYVSNQVNYKISTDEQTRAKFKAVIFSSLNNTQFQSNIQKALDFINKQVFNKSILKKMRKSCKTRKNNFCVVKRKTKYQTSLSFKRKSNTKFKNLFLNTRMSLFEL
jgi:hypothetical protein